MKERAPRRRVRSIDKGATAGNRACERVKKKGEREERTGENGRYNVDGERERKKGSPVVEHVTFVCNRCQHFRDNSGGLSHSPLMN